MTRVQPMLYRHSPLLPIFLIVLVDVLGMSLVLPLLPFYAESYGASPATVGALSATFALCQLVASPILGRLSDRLGRRPVLLLSQAGTFVGFVLLARADALWMIFLSRIVDGATAGNLAIAQAAISDVTAPEDRARSFALIGVAFGLGFLVGPAISGELAHLSYSYPAWLAALLSLASIVATATLLPDSSSAQRLVCASASVQSPRAAKAVSVGADAVLEPPVPIAAAAVVATAGARARVLPSERADSEEGRGERVLPAGADARAQVLPSERAADREEGRGEPVLPAGERLPVTAWGRYLDYLGRPILSNLLAQYFCFVFAFATFTSGFALFAERRLTFEGRPFGPREVGYVFAYAGLLGIFLQGGLIGRLVRRHGESRLAVVSFAATAIAYFGLGVTATIPVLVAVATVASFGTGALRPVLTSLVSRSVGAGEQGVVLGLNQSLNSLALVLAPLVGGALIGRGQLTAWAWVAASFAVAGLALSLAGFRGPIPKTEA